MYVKCTTYVKKKIFRCRLMGLLVGWMVAGMLDLCFLCKHISAIFNVNWFD